MNYLLGHVRAFPAGCLNRARGPLGLHSCFQRPILGKTRDGLHQPEQGPRQNQPTLLLVGYDVANDGVSARNQFFLLLAVSAYFPQMDRSHMALLGVSNPFFHYYPTT
ncbi:unnamed protein product [Prunus brigantina]